MTKQLERISKLERRLIKINRIIYAVGAPLGSDNYFKIRHIAADTEREVRKANPQVKGDNTMTELEPADRERCQVMRHEPFKLSGVNGRCRNTPAWIVRETIPGKDGLMGEQSCCNQCKKHWAERLPDDWAFVPLKLEGSL